MASPTTPFGIVLILEDDAGIRRLERSILERAGYQVELAAEIQEARQILAEKTVDLLLLDYRLGEGDNGLEFYRNLQAEGRDIPAILVTGFGDEARMVEAMRAGVKDFIPKSPNFIELVPPTVERVLAQVRQERRLKEAEAASRAKDDFLAALSHELRTPLTPVLALVSLLKTDERIPEDLREDLATIERNVQLEARLIDDLLDLTRSTRGKFQMQMIPFDFREILLHTIKTCCAMDAVPKDIAWTTDIPEAPIPVNGDAGRLTQVIWNVLKNALKFTPEHGDVHISTRTEEVDGRQEAIIRVRDNGIGIRPEMLPRIFGAFEQARQTSSEHLGGLGLGLAISKAIVESHGGTIFAESEGEGKGAAITIRLPLCAPELLIAPSPTAPLAAKAASAAHVEQGAHILIIEDHADTAAVMTKMLRHAGFCVTTAGGVADALAKMEQTVNAGNVTLSECGPVQLVVSDLGLPDGSGTEAMKELRRKYNLRGIALSGFGMEEDIRRAHEAGFAKHLTKPVDLQSLIRAIREVLASET